MFNFCVMAIFVPKLFCSFSGELSGCCHYARYFLFRFPPTRAHPSRHSSEERTWGLPQGGKEAGPGADCEQGRGLGASQTWFSGLVPPLLLVSAFAKVSPYSCTSISTSVK